jgi:hypothetical protein
MFSESYETYLVHRREWLENHRGEFVVIAAYDVAGFFPTFAEAYNAGRLRYGGRVFFLILRIHDSDQLAAVC